ncbi:MAG: penicillin-binding protein 2 [Xanthomonadales bacterium]|nr:penicillin-binding protein 2 [Xanthomonadales bacterium]
MTRRGFDITARVKWAGVLLAVVCAVLVGRAVDLQVLHNDRYQREGDARFLREVEISASRGMITDRNGEPLAVSSPVDSIWADPKTLLQHVHQHQLELQKAATPSTDEAGTDGKKERVWSHRDCVAELAQAVGVAPEVLQQRLDERADKEFMWVRRHVDPDQAEAILALGIPGVSSQREFRRFYPFGEAVSHVLGFTNIDDKGQEGLELAYDQWLSGKPGAKRVIRDGEGRQIAAVDLVRAAEPGKTLVLSIDRRLQTLAYRHLEQAVQEHHAQAGSMVVLDVQSGEILAMVSQPGFNPNAIRGSTAQSRRNRAITDVIEPGSTIKAFTVAAAMETGKVTPDTPIDTFPGTMQVAGHTIRDVRNYGTLTTTGLLTKSSNVAAAKLALDMSAEHMYHMLRRFGFGETTGSGFPGEQSGVVPSPRQWGTLVKATIAFGYGISVTPLQLARAYAAVGNGGRLVMPTFVKGQSEPSLEVIDPALARSLVSMLETVTGPGGTARRAAIEGYRVAGKSGTSRKAVAGGYEKRYISLFAGLVPASKPRFAVVVMVDDPRSTDAAGNLVYYGGLVAAPVFHDVMVGALRLMDVPADDMGRWYMAHVPAPSARPSDLPSEAEAVPDMFGGGP